MEIVIGALVIGFVFWSFAKWIRYRMETVNGPTSSTWTYKLNETEGRMHSWDDDGNQRY